jgi:NUDIX domain
VLISNDGERWGWPGGRPDGNESWEQTLRREVLEEACAIVRHARLRAHSFLFHCFSESRCCIAILNTSSSEPRTTRILVSSSASSPGDSAACGSTC